MVSGSVLWHQRIIIGRRNDLKILMATKNEENWMMHYSELKAYVAVHHHFPVRHTILNNWIRYVLKKIKAGTLPEGQSLLFEELEASRSTEHTGGRRKIHNK